MPIKYKGSLRIIHVTLTEARTLINKQLVDRFALLGDLLYQEALTKITYTHQTGNLGSSTGYIIVHDGVKIGEGGFFPISGPKRTSADGDGTEIGRLYAESLIPEFPEGFALIFVAGMYYAGYVEAKGYNVITSAELWAEREAARILNGMSL